MACAVVKLTADVREVRIGECLQEPPYTLRLFADRTFSAGVLLNATMMAMLLSTW